MTRSVRSVRFGGCAARLRRIMGSVLSFLVILLMMAAIFYPAYQATRPAVGRRRQAGAAAPAAATELPSLPRNTRLDDYVQQGLEDLRIMLVQAARRRDH